MLFIMCLQIFMIQTSRRKKRYGICDVWFFIKIMIIFSFCLISCLHQHIIQHQQQQQRRLRSGIGSIEKASIETPVLLSTPCDSVSGINERFWCNHHFLVISICISAAVTASTSFKPPHRNASSHPKSEKQKRLNHKYEKFLFVFNCFIKICDSSMLFCSAAAGE